MGPLRLHYPVHLLNGELLLPAGTDLTPETLDRVISSRRVEEESAVPILRYGTIRQDLLGCLQEGPDRVIFDDPQTVEDLLRCVEKTSIASPLIESLDYFKTNDPYTYLHILKVFALSTRLARTVVDDDQTLRLETTAGPLHDVGKICVPLKVLKKTAPLTRTERRLLEHHTLAGYVLLAYYLGERDGFLAKVAKEHHERRNGSGYPEGMRLDDLHVEIIVVADLYDALISSRPYRRTAYDNRTALEEITRMANRGELGWGVVKALIAINRSTKPRYQECVVSSEERGTPPEENVYGIVADEDDESLP
jgi:HD-GYP domain-containing protein (c-di-GMP phosphodiesterase class II)